MSTETYEYEKINAKDKPIAEDFVYVYSEIEDGGFRKVSKAMLKVLLGVATKLSELENDKAFITKTVLDLENYYLKSDTYSKDEIDNRISLIPRFDVQVVSSLPTTNISETTVYLVSSGDDSDNLYTEYINVNGLWEILGTQKIASVENAVLYTEQSLTEEQKTQARTNISAASSEEVRQLEDTVNNYIGGVEEPTTDDIPKVFFDEPIPQTKDDVKTKFRYISKTQDIEGYAEFKAQGNSSMHYPKKNMTVKLYKDEALEEKLKVDFKGWGEQRKFCLKANWIDLTHARNVVSARIWADIVRSRSNFAELPLLYRESPNLGAVDGFPIKVYSQGIYQGRYTWNIPKDAWTFNMDDSLDEHCVLCSEDYASSCFRKEANIHGGDWSDEIHDVVPISIKNRWNEIIRFVMNATNETFKANIGNYMDVASLIDYYIFAYVSCGLDSMGKNQIYFTYDGQHWYASMYDMDSTWGLYWTGTSFVSPTYRMQEDYETGANGTSNLLYDLLAINFAEEIKERYLELRNSVLSVPNIINHFERFTDIASLDLVKEDYATTTGSGKFTTIPSKDTNNIQQIRQFVIDRLAYVDGMIAPVLSSISATYTGGSVLVGTELSELTGLVVTANYSNGVSETITDYELSGIIAEGKNIITITYGDMTTTITVNGYLEGEEVVELVSISATYTGGEVVEGTRVNTLTGVTVTGIYSDGSTSEITDYVLSGVIVEGENTITVTFENVTTTFIVIGFKDDTLLYTLPQEMTLNGSSDFIDTGVKLFDSEKDVSVLVSLTCTPALANGTAAIMQCNVDSNAYTGFYVRTVNSVTNTTHPMRFEGIKIGHYNDTDYLLHDYKRTLIYTLDTATKTESLYLDGELLQSKTYATLNTNTQTLHLGCRDVNGTKDWFFRGIIHDCKVYNYALSAEQIASMS